MLKTEKKSPYFFLKFVIFCRLFCNFFYISNTSIKSLTLSYKQSTT